jgi:hypothetical protein
MSQQSQTNKNGVELRTVQLLAKAQAGELMRFDSDAMAECKPLFDQGYLKVINVRDVYVTRKGVDVLKSVGWDRQRGAEFFECWPEDLPPLEEDDT